MQGATNSFLISVSNTFVDYRQVGYLIRVREARLLFHKIRFINNKHLPKNNGPGADFRHAYKSAGNGSLGACAQSLHVDQVKMSIIWIEI